MPGRHFTVENGYRYGFNGKENDNEVKGEGNQVAYENRIYDPRLGRWHSLDPLQKKYPNESNYTFVSNNPLVFSDVDGRDKIYTLTMITKEGTVFTQKWREKDVFYYSKVPGKGFGNNRYFKQDILVNVVVDQRNGTGSYSQDLGVRNQIPAAFYYWNKVTTIDGSIFNSEIGSQTSGITFTSSFTLEVNGPKTFAKIPTGEVYNIDALMAMNAYTKSGEPLKLKLDDLAEWINHAKESKEAYDNSTSEKEKNENSSLPLVIQQNSPGVKAKKSNDESDPIRVGDIYYNKTLKSKVQKNKNGTSALYYGPKAAKDTVPSRN